MQPANRNAHACILVVIGVVLGVAIAPTTTTATTIEDRNAQITSFRVVPADDRGVYKYAYSTSNGIDVQAAGSPIEAIGIFKYTAPEGQPIEVRYIADELGFHAVGRHLPRPPLIPDYILRSIEYNRLHPNSENRIGSGHTYP